MRPEKRSQILLVDDDAPTTRVVRLALELDGYDLETCSTREEAVDALAALSPDLLIMDYRMGGLGPDQFIAAIRAGGYEGPILLCTAMDRQLELDVDAVLRKPFDPDDLSATVRRLLEASNSSKAR